MTIYVYGDWIELNAPTLIGALSVTHTKGREVFSFEYDREWLKNKNVQQLDPDLRLYSGPQYLSGDKPNFGLFLDSSPDRWGRVLMDRREALIAKQENRKPKKLFEEDYLLGVVDEHRMGALRFKVETEGQFLNENKALAAPPWTTLRELEHASLQFEKGLLKDDQSLKWINLLLAPGASLGGARPKASVIDPKGDLWIAKFPSVKDQINVGAWEMVVNELAGKAGLYVAEGKLKKFNTQHHTFLTKRFDRQKKKRIHFASAMTLLGQSDGVSGMSYLNLAEFIMQHGASPNKDLEELWKRIVFNIAVKNIDDHLRNHGFMLTPKGWNLSPAYDVNPVYFGKGLTLNISETDNSLDVDLAISVADFFRVKNKKAHEIVLNVKDTVKEWSGLAKNYAIPKTEIDIMSQAFE
jgi:serine/threonine-protein kinase HipA